VPGGAGEGAGAGAGAGGGAGAAAAIALKVAVTECEVSIVTLHDVPSHVPPQPPKLYPASGTAANATTVDLANRASHPVLDWLVQLIPSGELITVPPALTDRDSDSFLRQSCAVASGESADSSPPPPQPSNVRASNAPRALVLFVDSLIVVFIFSQTLIEVVHGPLMVRRWVICEDER